MLRQERAPQVVVAAATAQFGRRCPTASPGVQECRSTRCPRSCSSVSTTHLDHLHPRNTLTAPRCHFSLTSSLSFARQVARRRCGNCHQEITRATPRTSLAPIPATQHLAPVSPLSLSTPQSRPDTEGTTIPPTLCNRTRRAWHAQRSDFTAERYSRLWQSPAPAPFRLSPAQLLATISAAVPSTACQTLPDRRSRSLRAPTWTSQSIFALDFALRNRPVRIAPRPGHRFRVGQSVRSLTRNRLYHGSFSEPPSASRSVNSYTESHRSLHLVFGRCKYMRPSE